MTKTAVSSQIKLLEERLGVPLFHRERRRVRLSKAGRRAIERVSAAFGSIAAAFAQARATRRPAGAPGAGAAGW